MQLTITPHLILLCCVASLHGKTLYSKGCFECEEELWEEVSCDDILTNITTISVSHSSTPIYKLSPSTPSTTPSTISSSTSSTTYSTIHSSTPSTTFFTPISTTNSPVFTTAADPYKKYYCECKKSCKEFCRKLVLNSPEKQIYQAPKLSHPLKNEHFESTQREFLQNSDYIAAKPYNCRASLPIQHTTQSVTKFKDKTDINSNIHAKYYQKPIPVVDPIYYSNVVDATPSTIDSPISLENIMTRNSKTLRDPAGGVSIPLDVSTAITGNPSQHSYTAHIYLPPVPMKETQTVLGIDLNYDSSFDSLIKEFLNNNPPKDKPIQSHSMPLYSVSV